MPSPTPTRVSLARPRTPARARRALLLCAPVLAALLLLPAPARAGDEAGAPFPKRVHKDLVFDRGAHDFGNVKQNTVHRTEFTYTNKGSSKVTGIRARGECGCSAVKVSKRDLDPGESGTLGVEFNTLTLSGHLNKRIHIYSSDRTRGEALLAMKISIVKGLVVHPPSLSFGDVGVGTKPAKAFSLRWYDGVGEPFEIEEINAPDGFLVKKMPFRDARDARWRGWRIELTLDKKLPLGMYSDEVLVRTSDKERPRLVIALSANVSGKVWVQQRYLSFGSFVQGRKRSSSIKFRPFDKTVTFGKVSAKTSSERLRVEVKLDPYLGKDGVWKLIATVPVDAAPGSLEDETVELHTGVPGEEVTLLTVRGRVKPKKSSAKAAPRAPAAKTSDAGGRANDGR